MSRSSPFAGLALATLAAGCTAATDFGQFHVAGDDAGAPALEDAASLSEDLVLTLERDAAGPAIDSAVAARDQSVAPSDFVMPSTTPLNYGAACTGNSDCDAPLECRTNAMGPNVSFSFPQGYCTRHCSSDAECGPTAACIIIDGLNLCLVRCGGVSNAVCRFNYGCCADGNLTLSGTCAPLTTDTCR